MTTTDREIAETQTCQLCGAKGCDLKEQRGNYVCDVCYRKNLNVMGQVRQPLPDEFEMDDKGKIRDTQTGEIFGHVPIGLRSLYNASPQLLKACQETLVALNSYSTEPIPVGVWNRCTRLLGDALRAADEEPWHTYGGLTE